MKLSEVAQIMYNLQEYCRGLCHCSECDFCDDFCEIGCVLRIGSPEDWGITPADIERLRNKEIEPWTCKDCRQYPCAYPMDKICEGFELW